MLRKCKDCDLLHVGEAAEGGRPCSVPKLLALFEGVALSPRERAHLRWIAHMQVEEIFIPLITKLSTARAHDGVETAMAIAKRVSGS